ncbi:zinc finger protein 235-like [Patella vulgata]|uniref:zinc finger protein 235-like n=1 Tax=Patella vulgata TaxID=6465 RepID=UPI0024A9913A|nr:zinc finger protein 235-like [Patella vulgata]XP_050417510.2 zinc finger protein 235-like [Patella vulgata]XP_050417512.2 zinc finger protein 235-like [Patella vulgata]
MDGAIPVDLYIPPGREPEIQGMTYSMTAQARKLPLEPGLSFYGIKDEDKNTIIKISEKLIESHTKSVNEIVSHCSEISGYGFHSNKILDHCNQIVSETLNCSYMVISLCQSFTKIDLTSSQLASLMNREKSDNFSTEEDLLISKVKVEKCISSSADDAQNSIGMTTVQSDKLSDPYMRCVSVKKNPLTISSYNRQTCNIVKEKTEPFDNMAVEDSSSSNDDQSSIAGMAEPSSQTNSGSELTCSVCSKTFKTETTFKKHKQYHNRYNFVCEVCNGRFAGKLKLRKHVLSQTDEGHVKLRMTQNSFSQVESSDFINPGSVVKLGMNNGEMLSSSAGMAFNVLEENETFEPTKVKLEDNLTKIKVEKDDCPSSDDEIIDVVSEEPDRRQISSEVENHSEDKTEDHDGSDEGSLALSDNDGLEYNDNVNNDPDWDEVKQVDDEKVCTNTIKKDKSYKRHKLSHQIQNNTKDFVCEVCDKRFDMKHKLKTHIFSETDKEHIKLHVGKNPVKVKRQCEICGKQYGDMRYLERHLKIHSGVKEFACELCDYKSYSNEHLRKHMIRHTGIKKYICHHCGKGFPRKGDLIKHFRSHTGIRAFHCDQCPKSFVLSTNLARHRKVHIEELPYACEICGKRSRQAYNITVHMRTHNGHKPFACEICGNKFAHNVSLRQHKKSCHGEMVNKAGGDV